MKMIVSIDDLITCMRKFLVHIRGKAATSGKYGGGKEGIRKRRKEGQIERKQRKRRKNRKKQEVNTERKRK